MTRTGFITHLGTAATVSLLLLASAAQAQSRAELTADLTGAGQTPAGDPDGAGLARIKVDPAKPEVCYELAVTNITPAVAAHIHKGKVGEIGPPVVNLTAPATGSSSGCTAVAAELAQAILADPAGYYVNVHTPDFRPGAVRGQLKK